MASANVPPGALLRRFIAALLSLSSAMAVAPRARPACAGASAAACSKAAVPCSRRAACAGLGVLAAAPAAAPAKASPPEPVLDRAGQQVIAADWLETHADGRADLVLGYQGEPYFLLTRLLDDKPELEPFALKAECTHLGCLVANDPQGGFACPCHGSRYADDGSVLRGPAPQPLRLAKVEVGAGGALSMGAWLEADFRGKAG